MAAEKDAIVGIDLGTTYSSIAWVDSSGHVEVLPNSEGFLATNSVVFFDGQTAIVGREAAKATQDAGKIAGLNVVGIINEPTAGARSACRGRAVTEVAAERAPRVLLTLCLLGGADDEPSSRHDNETEVREGVR